MKENPDRIRTRIARIRDEIIVDCRDEDEQKMSWFYYIQDTLNFPFTAQISIEKKNGNKETHRVEIVRLCGDEQFDRDMTVAVCYQDIVFDVQLLSLKKCEADDITIEAIEGWKYWNKK